MSMKDGPDLYESGPPQWLAWAFIIITILVIGGILWFAGCGPADAAQECAVTIEKSERYVPRSVKKQVFREAGVSWEARAAWVVDHRVPLRLGGKNDRQNLQLQTKEEGVRKDIIEGFLHRCVCRGETPLPVAHSLISTPSWKLTDVRADCPRDRR